MNGLRLAAALPLLLALIGGDVSAETHRPVLIDRDRAVRTRHFNPDRPPDEMPRLEPPEAAVTVSAFSCSAQMRVLVIDQDVRGDRHYATARVESIEMKIGLDITVWLPRDATPKIKKHEDAHRKISDHYFEQAASTARNLADPYIGQTIQGVGRDAEDAVNNAIKSAVQELAGQYMKRIEGRAGKAQQAFDEITDHGRNDVPENAAIREAIKRASR